MLKSFVYIWDCKLYKLAYICWLGAINLQNLKNDNIYRHERIF